MKTFLTICTCAMISAGLYGFIDMAGDVTNGTMISYDQGDEETITISTAAIGVTCIDKAQLLKQAKTTSEYKIVVPKNEPVQAVIRSEQKKEEVKEISTETIIVQEEPGIVEQLTSDIMADSIPAAMEEEGGFDYSDFSRGEPRKHKKSKRSKK